MARRARSSQCWVITAIFLVVLLAFMSYPYQSVNGGGAQLRHPRDMRTPSSATIVDNISIDHAAGVNLTKRALVPPSSDADYNAAMVKGCKLCDWMHATQGEAINAFGEQAVSKYQPNDVTASGWTRQVVSDRFDPNSVAPYLVGLNNVEEFTQANRVERGTWVHTQWTQSKPYTRGSGEQTPTWGNYEQISYVSRSASTVIMLTAFSPDYMLHEANPHYDRPGADMPEIQRWSDIAYIEFMKVCRGASYNEELDGGLSQAPGRYRSAPRWFLIPRVWDPTPVITYCLNSVYGLHSLPTWENRVTFPIGSPCFYAILGTSYGQNLARFLITHKYRLGRTTLASVTIFSSGFVNPNGYDVASQLWWTVKDDTKSLPARQTIANIRIENNVYAQTPGSDLTRFPHMLRPKY